jgi:hypothetical protein
MTESDVKAARPAVGTVAVAGEGGGDVDNEDEEE